jgi:putative oxidoreductase
MLRKLTQTRDDMAPVFVQLMVGAVFLSEGIQKFLYPDLRGSGRFEKIGLPEPEVLGPLVGSFEVLCGALILLGLFTRLAAIPTLIIMLMALASTKSAVLANDGFWAMMHGSRTDWAMLIGSLYLLRFGSGRYAVDPYIYSKLS